MSLEFFLTAQKINTARSARLTYEELLDHLQRLYADTSQLSSCLSIRSRLEPKMDNPMIHLNTE